MLSKHTQTLLKLFLLFALLFVSVKDYSQISHRGQPYNWQNKQDLPTNTIKLPDVDVNSLLAEDVITEKHKDIPFRFAYAHQVNYNILTSGAWTNTKYGKVWRLRVKSEDAFSLNVTFSKYKLIEGAKLFIYNAQKTYFIGSFTHENNKENEQLGSTPVPGDDIIIELFEPDNATASSLLEIKTVAHDYKGIFNKIFKDYGDAGACNINTICTQGVGWENQIKSVALITLGDGTRICTGALVNNTAQNGTPYFLTANHCLDASVGTWMFIFGYESSVCLPSQDGSLLKSISGATLRANNANSDFGLLELSSIPPPNYNAYLSGWDNSDALPTNQTGIHHPSGDIKKISVDNNAATKSTFYSAADWQIGSWDQGTTEGGSSGSPLFDQNKRIIGQLEGGGAACGNTSSDYYGRFNASWNGASAATRLKDWLDPSNSGVTTLNGLNPNSSQLANDLSIGTINSISKSVCNSSVYLAFEVFNIGNNTVSSFSYTIKLNSTVIATSTWSGSITNGQNTTVNYGAINVPSGNNNIEVIIINPNGITDPNSANNTTIKNFNVYNPSAGINIKITLDDYGSETTWEIKNTGGTTIYSGGPYSDNLNGTIITEGVCLENGCYDFIIKDDANDGICCDYGNGSYTIDVFSTNLASSNGQFSSQQTKSFCITTAGIDEAKLDNISIFPNPANNQLSIENKENKSLNNVVLYDILGSKVMDLSAIQSPNLSIDLSKFSAGTYMLKVTSEENKVVSKKILIVR